MVIAGIVAGGVGSRIGGEVPKQLLELGGKPILIYTAETFLRTPEIDYVILGVNGSFIDYCNELVGRYFPDNKRIIVTEGGKERNATIVAILKTARERLGACGDDIAVTHDAVRPFVTERIITENIAAARKYGVCGTAIPSTDTVFRSETDGVITEIPPRSEMYLAQTPQSFRLGLFEQAYQSLTERERAAATDACKLFLMRGQEVQLIEGDRRNFKITYPIDYELAKALCAQEKKAK